MSDVETIANFPDLASARVAQSVLLEADIQAVIPDEYLSGVDWQMNTALHGIRLNVSADDAGAAREILATELTYAVEVDDDTCPRCQSAKFGPPAWKNRIKAAALFFFPVLLIYPLLLAFSAKLECYACGNRWSPDVD